MKPLACGFAVLAGFAAGWSAVRWIAPPDAVRENARSLVQQESISASAPPDAVTSGTTARERADALAAIFQQPSGPTRDRALAAAVMKLEAADFPAGAEGDAGADRATDLRGFVRQGICGSVDGSLLHHRPRVGRCPCELRRGVGGACPSRAIGEREASGTLAIRQAGTPALRSRRASSRPADAPGRWT